MGQIVTLPQLAADRRRAQALAYVNAHIPVLPAHLRLSDAELDELGERFVAGRLYRMTSFERYLRMAPERRAVLDRHATRGDW